jgi:hypothetical protein
MSRYDDDWSRNRFGRDWSVPGESPRRESGDKGGRGSYLVTLAFLVMLSTLGVVVINLLGYRLI